MTATPDPLRVWNWRVQQAEAARDTARQHAQAAAERRDRLLDSARRLAALQADYRTQLQHLQQQPHHPRDAIALQATLVQLAQLQARADREAESADGACRVADAALLQAAQQVEQARALVDRYARRIATEARRQEQQALDRLGVMRAVLGNVA